MDALMTDRALGLVCPASQPVEELPFTDKEKSGLDEGV